MSQKFPSATPEQIAEARRLYADDSDNDIEIDDNAGCNTTDHGTWIEAWVWLPKPEGDE